MPEAVRFLALVTFVSVLVFVAATPFAAPVPTETKLAERPTVTRLSDFERPLKHDLLVLAGGEKISGAVLNPTFRFRTAYGAVALETEMLASIELDNSPEGLATVITVNSNRLTGFVDEPVITVLPDSGGTNRLRLQRIASIAFKIRQQDLSPPLPGRWWHMRNGDWLTGRLLDAPLILKTEGDTLKLKPEEWKRLFLARNKPAQAEFTMTDGKALIGSLAAEDLSLQLDIGPKLDLYIANILSIEDSPELPDDIRGPVANPSLPVDAVRPGATNLPGLVWIPAGEFVMGSPSEEVGRDADEGPQTRVKFLGGFWIGKCEVTQGEYQRLMGVNPSNATGEPARPVERVNWFEAMEYCERLTKQEEQAGRVPRNYLYRLPTEAEWEYACRAGSASRFSYGEDNNGVRLADYGWFTRNSDSTPHPVGGRQANAWGLYDMHGNVWEWCLDRWADALPGGTITNTPVIGSGTLRVARGGSWLYEAKACRSANRDDYSPWDRCSDIGFRIVLAPLAP